MPNVAFVVTLFTGTHMEAAVRQLCTEEFFDVPCKAHMWIEERERAVATENFVAWGFDCGKCGKHFETYNVSTFLIRCPEGSCRLWTTNRQYVRVRNALPLPMYCNECLIFFHNRDTALVKLPDLVTRTSWLPLFKELLLPDLARLVADYGGYDPNVKPPPQACRTCHLGWSLF